MAKIDRGGAFFSTYGWTAFTLLGCASLPEGYVVPQIDRVLVTTTELERHVHRRLWETIQFTVDVMQPGGLEPDGPGLRAAQKVRLLHALVRHLLLSEETVAGNPGSTRDLGTALLDRRWDPSWGCPINQAQLAGTVLAFSFVILRGLDRLGYTAIEEADREAYLHRWNVVGHVMGVRDDLMASTMDDAATLFDAVRSPRMARSDDGVALARALVGFMQDRIPGWLPFLKPLPRMMVTELCETKTTELLEIDLDRRERAMVMPMLKVMQWWGRGEEDALRDAAPLRAGTRWLFARTARHMLSTPRGSHRNGFTVPDELRRQWGLAPADRSAAPVATRSITTRGSDTSCGFTSCMRMRMRASGWMTWRLCPTTLASTTAIPATSASPWSVASSSATSHDFWRRRSMSRSTRWSDKTPSRSSSRSRGERPSTTRRSWSTRLSRMVLMRRKSGWSDREFRTGRHRARRAAEVEIHVGVHTE